SLLPESDAEHQALGSIGEKARNVASEQADNLVSAAREKKDDLVAAAQEHVAPATDDEQSATAPGTPSGAPI
ncbi:hypothetical protein, partial [Novosphingobium sp. 9U]|uniref:hypothetical protein n=1 Tax=Novosphingobium sp. 9U TaxID=2653158 RepID=UPI00135B0F1E